MTESDWITAWLGSWAVCAVLVGLAFRTWNVIHLVGGGFIASLVLVIAVAEFRDRIPSDKEQSAAQQEMPLGQKLAIIDASTFVASDDTRALRFRYLLDSLNQKSGLPQSEIADMFVYSQTHLREKYGREVSLIELMEAVNASQALEEKKIDLKSLLALVVVTMGK